MFFGTNEVRETLTRLQVNQNASVRVACLRRLISRVTVKALATLVATLHAAFHLDSLSLGRRLETGGG